MTIYLTKRGYNLIKLMSRRKPLKAPVDQHAGPLKKTYMVYSYYCKAKKLAVLKSLKPLALP